MSAPTVAVIVVAAGSGVRLAADAPKAFVPLAQGTVLSHAVSTVAQIDPAVQIILVVPDGWQATAETVVADVWRAGIDEDARVVIGGATRHESVAAGLAVVEPSVDVVLVHDAARALTPVSLFTAVISAVRTTGNGVVPALPLADALKRVESARVIENVARDGLMRVQTPQGFPRERLDQAYATAAHVNYPDDASVFAAAGFEVDTVTGHEAAFKITFAEDLARAESIVAGLPEHLRVGTATDTHAFGQTRGLRLAGLDWPDEFRLDGHSDGDAVAHAIVDALLVAAGLGDIGSLVGIDDPAFAGASGDVFISRALARLSEHGLVPVNVTAQIVGNRPRFAARRAEAEQVLSAWVGAPVSLSATTTDGLGFTGEGRGIAVIATALVSRDATRI